MKKKISITAYTYGESKDFNRVSDAFTFFEKTDPTGWFIRFNGLTGDDFHAIDFIRSQKSQPTLGTRQFDGRGGDRKSQDFKSNGNDTFDLSQSQQDQIDSADEVIQSARQLRQRLQGISDLIHNH